MWDFSPTNLIVAADNEDEQRRMETRRNLAKKIETGSSDFNVVFDVRTRIFLSAI
jgi:hypothetical protein